MQKIVSIIVAILIFCIIIVFHELGHLFLAKRNGIMVPEFTIGFGPKLFGFKKGETEYNFRLILLGGACRMLGEDEDSQDERSFNSKGVWARFSTVFAGPFFNFILAFILSIVVIGIAGYDPCVVLRVDEGSAAEAAGLQVGDVITKFDGSRISIGRELSIILDLDGIDGDEIPITYLRDDQQYTTTLMPSLVQSYRYGFYYTADSSEASVSSVIAGGVFEAAGVKAGDKIRSFDGHAIASGEELSQYIDEHPLENREISIVFDRNGASHELWLTPRYSESYDVGFLHNSNGRVKAEPLQVIKYSLVEVKYWIVNTFKSLGMLVTGKLSTNDIGGPVRIVSELENTVEQSKSDGMLYVVLNLMNWAILLSANLGVMNLLPIPALDGGRLFFLLIEAVRRKKIPPEKEGLVHGIGLILLLILMVFIMFNDIRNLIF